MNRKTVFGFWRAVAVLVFVVSSVVPAVVVVAESGFSDIHEAGSHRPGVERLDGLGILDGTECEPGKFCPDDVLERWVMAVWLVRVLDGVDPVLSAATRFVDVDPHQWWAPFVERLAVLGVTVGCAVNPDRYCPHASVTRGQMATFLKRAFELAPGPSAGFVDIAGNTHADHIDALAAAEITVGCAVNPDRYCPHASVPRGQMATFLTRAIEYFPERTAIGEEEGEETAVLSVDLGSPSSATVTASFEVEITFSQPVTGFEQGHIEVVNGRASGFRGSGSVYRVTITPSSEGAVVAQIPAGVVSASSGDFNLVSERLVRTFVSDTSWNGRGYNTWDRAAVIRAYRAEFEREEPTEVSTGDVDTCDAGTTSQAYREGIVQRLNWFRLMAGVDTVTERAEYSAAAQETALMMAAAGRATHEPGTDWPCYTATGARTAAESNLGTALDGSIGIVDAYMKDRGSSNMAVLHRRWLLRPQLMEIGTGYVPNDSPGKRGANALNGTVDSTIESRPDVREPRSFVAWPPPGYVPATTAWSRWSFQLGGADFSDATVTVTDKFGPVPAEVIARIRGMWAIFVWSIYRDVDSTEIPDPPEDHCYTVTIGNVRVGGEVQIPYRYTTCVLDLTEQDTRVLSWQKPVWSMDGARITYHDVSRTLMINADGTDQRPLLFSTLVKWSPDGSKFIYWDYRGIWKLNADRSNPQLLATRGIAPVWSPDGTSIAFDRLGDGVWIMDADGTNQRQLNTNGGAAVWSPDGSRILYHFLGGITYPHDGAIFVMNADGTNQRQLSTSGEKAVWSPDGTKIAYERKIYTSRTAYFYEVWTMNADGTNQQHLSDGQRPVWSTDGTKIGYLDDGIWTMNADGTNQQHLTTSGGPPAWSPDGSKIAFHSWGGHVSIMNADGSNQQKLSK